MSILSYFPLSTVNIDGVVEEYKVKTGETISVGDFVKFVDETYTDSSNQTVTETRIMPSVVRSSTESTEAKDNIDGIAATSGTGRTATDSDIVKIRTVPHN